MHKISIAPLTNSLQVKNQRWLRSVCCYLPCWHDSSVAYQYITSDRVMYCLLPTSMNWRNMSKTVQQWLNTGKSWFFPNSLCHAVSESWPKTLQIVYTCNFEKNNYGYLFLWTCNFKDFLWYEWMKISSGEYDIGFKCYWTKKQLAPFCIHPYV